MRRRQEQELEAFRGWLVGYFVGRCSTFGGTGVSDCTVLGNHLSVLTSPSETAILHRNDQAPAIAVGRGAQSFGAGGGIVREGLSGYANPSAAL